MNNQSTIALLLIDMQNAYFNNDTLHIQQAELTEKINALTAMARTFHIPIFNVKTQHLQNIATWTLNILDDKQGYLFTGSNDAEIVKGLDTNETIEVVRTRDSAFSDTTLTTMFKNDGIKSIILCAASTHTCIFQTASDAYAANFRVILAKDAIATHQPQYHKNALTILQTEYRQRAMDMSQLHQYIQENCQ